MGFFNTVVKSVETITANLHKIIAELEAHAEEQLQAARDKQAAIAAAVAAHDAHKAEHQRATTIAGNIKNLLEV